MSSSEGAGAALRFACHAATLTATATSNTVAPIARSTFVLLGSAGGSSLMAPIYHGPDRWRSPIVAVHRHVAVGAVCQRA